MADQIEANYEQLEAIQNRFAQLADFVEQMGKDTGGKVHTLREEGWQGEGSDAFYSEMSDEIVPAIGRLRASLEKASETIAKVAGTIHEADEEAQGLFKAVAQ